MQSLALLLSDNVKTKAPSKLQSADIKEQASNKKFSSVLEDAFVSLELDQKNLPSLELNTKLLFADEKNKNIVIQEQEIKEIKSIKNVKDIVKTAEEKGLNLKSLKIEIENENGTKKFVIEKNDSIKEEPKTIQKESAKKEEKPHIVETAKPQEIKEIKELKEKKIDLKELISRTNETAEKKEPKKEESKPAQIENGKTSIAVQETKENKSEKIEPKKEENQKEAVEPKKTESKTTEEPKKIEIKREAKEAIKEQVQAKEAEEPKKTKTKPEAKIEIKETIKEKIAPKEESAKTIEPKKIETKNEVKEAAKKEEKPHIVETAKPQEIKKIDLKELISRTNETVEKKEPKKIEVQTQIINSKDEKHIELKPKESKKEQPQKIQTQTENTKNTTQTQTTAQEPIKIQTKESAVKITEEPKKIETKTTPIQVQVQAQEIQTKTPQTVQEPIDTQIITKEEIDLKPQTPQEPIKIAIPQTQTKKEMPQEPKEQVKENFSLNTLLAKTAPLKNTKTAANEPIKKEEQAPAINAFSQATENKILSEKIATSPLLSQNLFTQATQTIFNETEITNDGTQKPLNAIEKQEGLSTQEKNSESQSENSNDFLKSDEVKVQTLKNKISAAKSTISYFSNALKEQIDNYKAPLMKISMELNPKNLGSVEVTLLNRGKNLHVQINSNQQAINIFMQNSIDFKSSLNDLGYKDVAFNFSSNNGNQDNQNQRERNNQEYVMKYKEQNNEKLENELEIIIPDLIYG